MNDDHPKITVPSMFSKKQKTEVPTEVSAETSTVEALITTEASEIEALITAEYYPRYSKIQIVGCEPLLPQKLPTNGGGLMIFLGIGLVGVVIYFFNTFFRKND